MSDIIIKIFLMIVTTFLFVCLINHWISKLAVKIGAVDKPRSKHIHKKTVPKLGGLSIFLGFLLGFMLFGKISLTMMAVLIGSFIIIITGIMDDIAELSPRTKLIGQLIAALIITFYGGLLISKINAFGIKINFGLISYPITIFFIVACINCMNLIDGVDGLSGGICCIYFLTIGIVATMQKKFGSEFVISFVMIGSVLGFLKDNFYPAKMFAGDTGSMFMGYIMSITALLGFKNVTMTSFIVPMLVFTIPMLDTLFAIIRRTLKGEKITARDEDHIHHQLLNRKFSIPQTVLIIYIIDLLFALVSILYVLHDKYMGYTLYGMLVALLIIFIFNTNVIYDFKKEKKTNKKCKR